MLSSPEREVNGTPSAGIALCRLLSRPNRPAAPLRRSSDFAEDKTLAGQSSPPTQKNRTPKAGCPVSLWSGQRGSKLASRHPAEWLTAIRRTPAMHPSDPIAPSARGGRQRDVRFLMKKQDTQSWVSCFTLERATRLELATIHLGKVALYQMSYARGTRVFYHEKHPLVKTSSARFSEFSSAAAAASPAHHKLDQPHRTLCRIIGDRPGRRLCQTSRLRGAVPPSPPPGPGRPLPNSRPGPPALCGPRPSAASSRADSASVLVAVHHRLDLLRRPAVADLDADS